MYYFIYCGDCFVYTRSDTPIHDLIPASPPVAMCEGSTTDFQMDGVPEGLKKVGFPPLHEFKAVQISRSLILMSVPQDSS